MKKLQIKTIKKVIKCICESQVLEQLTFATGVGVSDVVTLSSVGFITEGLV